MNQISQNGLLYDWDPGAMLSNLPFLEQEIHQLQELLHMIVGWRGQVSSCPDEIVIHQQQLITEDLTSIMVQLISNAGGLPSSVKHSLSTVNPLVRQLPQLNGVVFPLVTSTRNSLLPQKSEGTVHGNIGDTKPCDQTNRVDQRGKYGMEQNNNIERHEFKDEDDANEEEHLPPAYYEVLQLEKEEIRAPHTHFCTICGKGFKRDANLRMHVRGHEDKISSSELVLLKRYSCPYAGCKQNKGHKKFQPLKTILCVKNHYKRSHYEKAYTCSRCNTKKFSVIADLKTHEKHCGKDKWLCSCGTTFSRKDKLFGHIAPFHGHTPAIPLEENKGSSRAMSHADNSKAATKDGSAGFSFAANASNGNCIQSILDITGNIEDTYFSVFNFDTCNLGALQQFQQPAFDDSDGSFSFLISGEKSDLQSGTNDIE